MKAIAVRTTIAPDGTIDLHVPSDLPPGEAEVVIVVQPVVSAAPDAQAPLSLGSWRLARADARRRSSTPTSKR